MRRHTGTDTGSGTSIGASTHTHERAGEEGRGGWAGGQAGDEGWGGGWSPVTGLDSKLIGLSIQIEVFGITAACTAVATKFSMHILFLVG
eukprot:SAG11_NODE_6_length_32111_cov_33.703174_12_plen_90_part_00